MTHNPLGNSELQRWDEVLPCQVVTYGRTHQVRQQAGASFSLDVHVMRKRQEVSQRVTVCHLFVISAGSDRFDNVECMR